MKILEALRFILELCAVAALAFAGSSISPAVAIAAPLALVVIWGAFIAPKARHRLADPARLAGETVIFAAVGATLAAAGPLLLGAALATTSFAVAGTVRLGAEGPPR